MSPTQLAAPTTDRVPARTTTTPTPQRVTRWVYPVGHPELARPLY
jgi:hypothetical protein